MPLKDTLTTWNLVTKAIVGTVGTVIALAATINWFQPRATAETQHGAITQSMDMQFAQSKEDATREGLEAELERVETRLKLYADIKSRRTLTPDEELAFGYLLTRHEEITKRLYAKDS